LRINLMHLIWFWCILKVGGKFIKWPTHRLRHQKQFTAWHKGCVMSIAIKNLRCQTLPSFNPWSYDLC
jgi:hypothetical protein